MSTRGQRLNRWRDGARQSVHDPEELPKVLARWKASIATGEPFNMVFPLLGADGVFRPFLTLVMPVHDRTGKVQRWFGTNTDISEQQSEERLRLALAAAEGWARGTTTRLLARYVWDTRGARNCSAGTAEDRGQLRHDSYRRAETSRRQRERARPELCNGASIPPATAFSDIEYRTVGLRDGGVVALG